MKFPTKMQVAGQVVYVQTQPDPIYQFYKCPVCVDGEEAYSFPVLGGKHAKCPACGCETVQPMEAYVMGCYSVLDDLITLRVTETNTEAAGTNFVHETVEAVNSICDLQLDHTQITTLSTVLYQAFSSGGVNFAEAA